MTSHYGSTEAQTSVIKNCTTASTFMKPNSLKFELLFGDYCRKIAIDSDSQQITHAFDYHFLPGKVFGFSYESFGADFKKLHHGFVLRACGPGGMVSVVPGISPGAEILVKTLSGASTLRLKSTLQKLVESGLHLSQIDDRKYQYLNYLLETRSKVDFFVGKLIEQYGHY